MRVLSESEQDRIKILTSSQVSFTLIEPTQTGLNKSIMDATGSVRSFFKRQGIHDYELQPQGPNHKVIIPVIIHKGYGIVKTKASLYRPLTKKGDPRIWFYGLTKIIVANEILGITFYDNCFQIFNLSQLKIENLLDTKLINPFKELVNEIKFGNESVATELIQKLKNISSLGFIKSMVNSDTGVGRTLEALLGIEMNSSKTPDYKGIELKSFRDKRNNRKGLFGKVPNWKLSKFKSAEEILDNFGYWEDGIFRIYNTMRATGRNAQGLILKIDEKKDCLIENSDKPEIGDFLVWELETLRNRLLEKHKETFWIKADSKIENSNEYFHYKEIEHTKNPMVEKFEFLINSGDITNDYCIKRKDGAVKDKGCNFKLASNSLDLLFPPSIKQTL